MEGGWGRPCGSTESRYNSPKLSERCHLPRAWLALVLAAHCFRDCFETSASYGECMEQGPGLMESVAVIGESLPRAPQFLVEVQPWHRVFFRNLADSVWTRRPPPLELASPPGDFWPDVFVASPQPWGRFL